MRTRSRTILSTDDLDLDTQLDHSLTSYSTHNRSSSLSSAYIEISNYSMDLSADSETCIL
jgi:hypothetical protein